MGPQHPSTHGVLRLMLELDGETVLRTKPVIGYLHTGMEKTAETLTYLQGGTNVTRMDYASPIFNELAFCLAAEELLGLELPPRAAWIRMLMCELNRLTSHFLFLATNGMDLGSTSMMIYGWREREEGLRILEMITGLRMNHNFIRVGGTAADLPDGWQAAAHHLPRLHPRAARGVRGPHDQPADLARAPPGRRHPSRPRRPWPSAPPAPSCAPPATPGTSAATCRTSPTTRSTST